MKHNFICCNIITLLLFTITMSSCRKDSIIPIDSHKNVGIYTRGGILDCEKQISHEYDILALIENFEYANARNVALELIDTATYEDVLSELNSVESMGFSSWLNSYAGGNLSSELKAELVDLVEFTEKNGVDEDFNEQLDDLIEGYLSDGDFNVVQKNLLVLSAEGIKASWEFEKCEESEFSTRGDDDEEICAFKPPVTFQTNCGSLTLGSGAVAGVVIGWLIGGPIGAGFGLLLGTIGSHLTNPYSCDNRNCDDCDHPSNIVLVSDYFNCKYVGAEALGAFEFAENWLWNVQVATGSFSTETDVPRVNFPGNFDPENMPFTITCRTLCDGQNLPNPIEGTEANFSGDFEPIAWLITGPVAVDRIHNFTYKTSELFGNLSNPTWDAGEEAELVSSGLENGRYYAVLNFSGVTTSWTEFSLTLYDDCVGANQIRFKTVRTEHE